MIASPRMDTLARTTERQGRVVLVSAVVLAASTLILRLADLDLFSSIAVGRWIVEHGEIPTRDPFSYASAGPFHCSEALSAVIFYLAHHAVGDRGLSLFLPVLAVATLALVVLRARGSPAARAVVIAMVVAGSHAAMALKPQIFSYLLFATLLLALERAPKQAPRRLFFLPLLFVVWANLHRGGVFGIAVVAVAAVAFWLDASTRAHARVLLWVLPLCVLALTINRAGTFYLTSAFDVLRRVSFRTTIAEWQPLTIKLLLGRHLALVPLVALALVERAARTRKVDPELLILVASCALATRGARLLPFVAIAAAPAAVRAVDLLRRRISPYARVRVVDAFLGLLFGVVLLANYELSVPAGYRGLGVFEGEVPVDLAAFLAMHRPPGPLFHSFDFGGYLLYALAPETKVLIDGRNDTVYDDDLFRQVVDAERSPAAFAELDARFAFAVAAFKWTGPGDARGAFLIHSPDWVLVYWDDLSTVYAHRVRARAMVALLGYQTLHVDSAFERANEPAGGPNDALFLGELERNAHEAARSARAHYILTVALAARGARDEALGEAARVVELAEAKGLPIKPPPLGP